MRYADIYLDSRDKDLYSTFFIRQGENLASVLRIHISDEFDGYGYNIIFQLNDATPIVSGAIYAVDGVIEYPITNALTSVTGNLKIEFQANDISNGFLMKNAVIPLQVKSSIDGTITEPMPESYVPWYTEVIEQTQIATEQANIATEKALVATNAENIDEQLSISISEANTSKANLDDSITNGNLLKTNLDNNISNGNVLKNDLNNSVTNGNATLTDLNNAILSGDIDNRFGEVVSELDTLTTEIADVEKYTNKPIATYTHTTNKEVVISAIDLDTDTFTSVGHGLVNGNRISVVLNSNNNTIDYALKYLPTNLNFAQYYIVNATTDTFQLSTTSGGHSG